MSTKQMNENELINAYLNLRLWYLFRRKKLQKKKAAANEQPAGLAVISTDSF